jgi:hypothetical protein
MSHHVPAAWEEHEHEPMHHVHEHYHVEHFYLGPERGWGITSSVHVHTHDHGPVSHRHAQHENFAYEHANTAHSHDHEANLDFNAAPDTEGAGMERPVGV